MTPDERHLSSEDLAAAAAGSPLSDSANEHVAHCLRCRSRLQSARYSFGSIGRQLSSPITRFHQFSRRRDVDDAREVEREAPGEHVTQDQILALETEAAYPAEIERWRAHLLSCAACSERARSLHRYAAQRGVAAFHAPAPGTRSARIRALPAAADALLQLESETPRREIVLTGPGPEVRLEARLEGERRIDVTVAERGVLVALHSPTGRVAHAVTGRDGRVTLPLAPGRSRLLVGTTPGWEIEIDL